MEFTSIWYIGWFGWGLYLLDLFLDMIAEFTLPLPPRNRRGVRLRKLPLQRLSGKKWRALRRNLARYASERNKWRPRRFYLDRAAYSNDLFKRWKARRRAEYYATRVHATPNHHRSAEWKAKRDEYVRKRAQDLADMRSKETESARKHREQKELEEFLDCDGVPFALQGKFRLPKFTEAAVHAVASDFATRKFGEPPPPVETASPPPVETVPSSPVEEEPSNPDENVSPEDDHDFDSFLDSPFNEEGSFVISQLTPKVIADFISRHVPNPTRFMTWQGMTKFHHELNAQAAVNRMKAYSVRMLEAQFRGPQLTHVNPSDMDEKRNQAYYHTPCIVDSGASFGLTPFREDFITYQEVDVTVKGVNSENKVYGVGTVLYRCVATNGDTCWIPGVAYHLPATDIRLFSPQCYHQHYGGFSILDGDSFDIHLPKPFVGARGPGHILKIPIDACSNLPTMYGAACTEHEQMTAGIHFRSFAAVQQELEGAFFGQWDMTQCEDCYGADMEIGYNFGPHKHLFYPCVTADPNANLTNPQKEILLWHLKLNIGIGRIQNLMKPHSRTDGAGNVTWHPKVIEPKYPSSPNCDRPLCGTCQIAQAKAKAAPKPAATRDRSIEDVMSKENYKPGDFVSMDTIGVKIPGRPFHGRGADPLEYYAGCTIFHDAATNIVKIYPQVSLATSDTLLSKAKFEDFLWQEGGVRVKKYHSDQGVFTSKGFTADCVEKQQTQSFSAVGAKWQNGFAERAVRTIFWKARHMLLNCALRWSTNNADDARFWPQAVQYSEWLHNRTPNDHGYTPLELLTQRIDDHHDLRRAHVFGAPVYVLDARLQDGKRIPRFDHRARLAQFMGFGEQTSSLSAVVRHLNTESFSTQLHCVFDDKFETVSGMLGEPEEALDDTVQAIWTGLFETEGARDWYVVPEQNEGDDVPMYDVPPLDDMWLTPTELREKEERLQDSRRYSEQQRIEYEQKFAPTPLGTPTQKVRFDEAPTVEDGTEGVVDVDEPISAEGDVHVDDDSSLVSSEGEDADDVPDPESTTTWSQRLRRDRKPSLKVRESTESTSKKRVNISHSNWQAAQHFTPREMASLSSREKSVLRDPRYHSIFGRYVLTLFDYRAPIEAREIIREQKLHQKRSYANRAQIGARSLRSMLLKVDTVEDLMTSPLCDFISLAVNDCIYTGPEITMVCNDVSPWFLNAKCGISAQDNPGWNEAMSGTEAEQYWEAAKTEIATLEGIDAWEVVDKSSVPPGQRILKSLWAFKRKRTPSGVVKKYKARLTARGDMQVAGVDFTETYAPVCSWSTVRLMFTLQLVLGLKSASADVACAFLHSPLDENETVYMECPKGFEQPGKCLRLKQSLYGLRQSPRNFFQFLSERMRQCGFEESVHDQCLFVSDKVIAVAYVDDILFWAKDEKDITQAMIDLRNAGLNLEKESDCAGFLGVDITELEHDENGRATKLELTQTGLIDRVIANLGLNDNSTNKYTPAEAKPLGKDLDGEPAHGEFNYAAVVGQLLYLAGHTRPDIAFAVNVAARYMFTAKRSHELALKRIGRYLKATRNKGMIVVPSDNILSIEAFPDADFAGMYGHENPSDPSSVRSRTGFVILAANCPILWKSQLQSKTALSTMEAEIGALAHCCKELFPLMDLASDLAAHFGLDPVKTTMNVTVHEDNASALILGNTIPPEYTPRSKFFHLETIWFREQIVKRGIKLIKVDTTEQLGDIFTKGLSRVVFEYLRKKLMGW